MWHMPQQLEAMPHQRKCACHVSALIVTIVSCAIWVKSMTIEHHSVDICTFLRSFSLAVCGFAARTELLLLHAHSVP